MLTDLSVGDGIPSDKGQPVTTEKEHSDARDESATTFSASVVVVGDGLVVDSVSSGKSSLSLRFFKGRVTVMDFSPDNDAV